VFPIAFSRKSNLFGDGSDFWTDQSRDYLSPFLYKPRFGAIVHLLYAIHHSRPCHMESGVSYVTENLLHLSDVNLRYFGLCRRAATLRAQADLQNVSSHFFFSRKNPEKQRIDQGTAGKLAPINYCSGSFVVICYHFPMGHLTPRHTSGQSKACMAPLLLQPLPFFFSRVPWSS
jgi:hypothetical protein